jgi:prolyl oligopeptidase
VTSPPPTRREEVTDLLHGVEVHDPYRWLENTDDPAVRRWVDEQNEHSRKALDALPQRMWWHERLVALMRQPDVLRLQVRKRYVVSLERPADADQAVLAVRTSNPDVPMSVAFDPAASGDPTAAVDWYEMSPTGDRVLLGVSSGGTERSTMRLLWTKHGVVDGFEIPDTRAASVTWEPDGNSFFYTRYPPGDEYHRSVHHHDLVHDEDSVVWFDPDDPEAWPDVELSSDGMWLLVHVSRGWSQTDVYLNDRSGDRWLTLVEGERAQTRFHFADSDDALIGVTTFGASNGRVVRVPLPERDGDAVSPAGWSTLVGERDEVLGVHRIVGDEVWLVASDAAVDRIERWSLGGDPLGSFNQLGPVSVTDVAVDELTDEVFVVVQGFDSPPTVWHGRAGSSQLALYWRGDTRLKTASLTVRRVNYPSLDGTEIGMFLVHRADIDPDTSTPTILNGYGGFAIAETPVWSAQIAAWCEAGGLYAIAGLRGGLEHGEDWHLAGKREQKQNVFDDFASAGDWLVAQGLTSRERLAIVGRSNGGLLVGAALTQRPDLCRAVWCGVPLLDMIRFPQFLIARLWTEEYGDPGIEDEFAWLHSYSPYHHVQTDVCYPATLFTCAEGDSRVHPLHARKMTALMQSSTTCADERPVLLIEERAAGHGVGKPVTMRADEFADALTFLSWQLGWEP